MFIVRRAFRNNGTMLLPGSVVEPGSIKRFKSRLRDNRIIEVEEQDLDKWRDFFMKRYGVAIADIEPPVESPVESPVEPPAEPTNDAQATTVVKPVAAVVTAVSK